MTVLEKLIRTASNDAALHYREMARAAQKEFEAMLLIKQQCDNFDERVRRGVMCGPKPKSSCPPENSVDK